MMNKEIINIEVTQYEYELIKDCVSLAKQHDKYNSLETLNNLHIKLIDQRYKLEINAMEENEAFNAHKISFSTNVFSETLKDCQFLLASRCNRDFTLIVKRPAWNSDSYKEYYEIIEDAEPPLPIRPCHIHILGKAYKIEGFEMGVDLFSTADEFSTLKITRGQQIKV